ncbi:MAG TPA: ion channel [Blastocatellia bacterium]|nr:ion channel [Blastocatellia bacterium]
MRRASKEEENRDLGFGSVVAHESRQRLLNRDGSFNVARRGLSFWTSLSIYHRLLTMSWSKFLSLVALFYLIGNLIFAFAYMACGPGALVTSPEVTFKNDFLCAFFFSVETFATIGYGNIIPTGPAAHVIVTIESLVGLLGFALATGLLFARFSRPTAKIIFSQRAIVAPYGDITAFEFRITNARTNQIIELEAKILFAQFEKDEGGKSVRRFYPLTLERDKVVFFPLSWTIVHPVDETSPLYGLTQEDLRRTDAEFLILLTGIDETFSQTVHARSSYKADEVIWNARFANVFNRQLENDMLTIDVRRIDIIERVETSSNS